MTNLEVRIRIAQSLAEVSCRGMEQLRGLYVRARS